jgi:competence ComEA-like helix-hairpin-helix protein
MIYLTNTQIRAIWFIVIIIAASVLYHYINLYIFRDSEYDFSEFEHAFLQKRDSILAREPEGVQTDSIPADKNPTSGITIFSPMYPININTASIEELQNLPRIGPKMAERIVQHRQEVGLFQTISDFKKVRGIGDKTFQNLKDLISIQ